MNESLYVNNHGLRLITQFEGAPRLSARLCEGGRYELGYGVTFHPDGRPVERGETCTDDYAMAMFRNALTVFEDVVRRHVTIELNSNQFSALVALTYNIGEENFATGPKGPCTVLRETNARRFEDAAAAFGMWVFATKDGYRQALRGLLRRHYSEACLYLGYDWTLATEDDAIALQRIVPEGDPPQGADRVTYKTPFVEVLRIAQHYPLPALDESPEPVQAVSPVPAPMEQAGEKTAVAPVPDSAKAGSELVLTKDMQAAPAVKPDAAGAVTVPPTQVAAPVTVSKPEPAKPSNSPQAPVSASVKEATAAAPPSSPVALPNLPAPKPAQPPVIPGVDGVKPKSPWTVQPEDVHYRLDPGAGLKPLEDSDRAKAVVMQRLFLMVIYLGGAGIFGSTFTAGSELLMKHPALMSVILDLAVPLALSLLALFLGAVGKSWADWKRHKAQERACQGLY